MKEMECAGLEKFIEIAIDATIIINEYGVIRHVNSRAEELLNYSRNEMIGKSVGILVSDASRINHSVLRKFLSQKKPTRNVGQYINLKARTQLGKEIPVSIGLSPFRNAEHENQTLVSIRDNTVLHETKERIDDYIAELKNITETAIDAIITMDSESKILSWNMAAFRLFGHSEEEAKGQLISIIIPKKMRQDHFNGVTKIASGGESKIVGKTVEVEGIRKSGEIFPLSLSITTWLSKRGRVFCGILRDITERVEAEKKLLISLNNYN